MFTIDLLKGQSIPTKSRPGGIAFAAVTFALPVIIAIVMLGLYLSNSIATSIQREKMLICKTKTQELSIAVELQKSLQKEKETISRCLSDVTSAIGRHTQWSPILVEMVKSMPDSIVLTNLEVEQRSVTRKIPKKDNPMMEVSISIPVRTLRISVSGNPQSDCDKAVRDFGDCLRFSTVLEPELEDIRVSKQYFSKLEGKDVVSYDIDCVFKPGL